ncbi:hypothetical protein N7468_005515 [Penicillium chermesinum]|uniref:Uncharacterized protein n=1 Tax=Penicillium chermesinum TaxID=63820 RepID=A0A9W9NZG8_9EURO|nr:uncharacterized protein N7468_005515 [Penicillium chermesinum]KAJ5232559.1 hypothetical protein N7468_005515 [Penicillium chermesinum]
MLRPKPHSKSGEESLEEQKEPFVDQALDRDEGNGPNLDIASGTRTGCIAAVSMGVILSLLCLISGIYLVTQKSILGAPVSISPAGQEAVSLVINFILALCTDGMMFVHSASLRWALYREERLEYNTNIRLFTSSKRFGPNSWYINLVALACLILTYASSSVLLVSNQAYMGNENGGVFFELMINATALIALGLGLAGQAAIAVWCLVSCQKSIPTWSSNPLNTASVALHKGDLVHRPGRCMLSVHQRTMPSQEAYPGKRQGSMFQVQHIVRYILALIWSLALLAIAWPIAIATVSRSIGNDSYLGQGFENPCWKLRFDWEKSDWACSRNFVTLSMSPTANDHNPSSPAFSYGAEAVLCILFVCLVQALQTIVLHCLELLVNLSRDEGLWRQAYRGTKEAPGTQLSTNPFLSAASSWENIVLFISKALLHWIIGAEHDRFRRH